MPSSLRDLINGLLGTRDAVQPGIQAFPYLDAGQMAKDLRIEDRGRERGAVNQPPTDAIEPDFAEIEIRQEIERRARKAEEDYRAQLGLYEGRIARGAILGEQWIAIETAVRNAVADFRAAAVADQNVLQGFRRELELRQREYSEFTIAEGLKRGPRIVSTGERYFALLVMAILLIAESILNGMFFAKGSEAGIIGGVVQALTLSVLNVGVAFLVARHGVPQLFHRLSIRKVVGALSLLTFLAWVAGLNLSIGHYRDLFAQNGGSVPLSALADRLMSNPLGFEETQSAILALIGIGIATLASLSAFRLGDPYPGFGAVGLALEVARSTYADQSNEFLDALRARRDAGTSEIEEAVEAVRSVQHDREVALEGRSRLHRAFVAYLDHLATSHEALVRRYREANVASRSTSEPAYFRRAAALRSGLLPPEAPTTFAAGAQQGDSPLEFMRASIRELNAEYEASVPVYRIDGEAVSEVSAVR